MTCALCGYIGNAFDVGCQRCNGRALPTPAPPTPRCRPVWHLWLGRTLGLLLVASLSGFFSYNAWLVQWRTAQRENVLEAVVRYNAHPMHAVQGSKPSRDIVFLSVEGRDPSPRFMRRFGNDAFSVRAWSQHRVGTKTQVSAWSGRTRQISVHLDKSTDEEGHPFQLDSVVWKWDGTRTVVLQTHPSVSYKLVLRNGKWRVVNYLHPTFCGVPW